MKGILKSVGYGTSIKWIIEYNDSEENRIINYDVREGRIDGLSKVGTILNSGDEVSFKLFQVEYFPYKEAVPYVETTENIVLKKTIKKQKLTLWLTGFDKKKVEVICDRYDASSSGYWYFYDNVSNNGTTKYIAAYPIGRTAIHKIEDIEIEIE